MTHSSRMWDEDDNREFVAVYMEKLRRGEDVFFNLIEGPGGSSIVSLLIEEFRGDTDSRVRRKLVKVVAEFRLRSSIPFLSEALGDASATVWQAALDGLFSVPCAESLAALESACACNHDPDRRRWISEAVDLMREQLANG